MTSRRETLRTLGSFAALPFFGTLGLEELVEVGRRAHSRARPGTLAPAQHAIVVLAAERIIPRTATPGATDARVADFIDVMLADWYNATERERFIAGVNELGARGFTGMTPAQQAAVLETLDGEVQALRLSRSPDADRHWFAMLKFLTVWGYYTSRPGIVEEIRVAILPGRYEGNAPY